MRILALLVLSLVATGCTFHSRADESAMHGVMGIRGEPIEYQSTTNVALHGLFIFDLIGDGSTTATISDFMKEADNKGASRARITQTSSLTSGRPYTCYRTSWRSARGTTTTPWPGYNYFHLRMIPSVT